MVVMSAYAPLFVNVNPGGMQWSSDLIGYDALNSYGSPSYYAQVMFASCLGDHTLLWEFFSVCRSEGSMFSFFSMVGFSISGLVLFAGGFLVSF